MPKPPATPSASRRRTAYVCSECGADYAKWQGQCEACGAWNTLAEIALESAAQALQLPRRELVLWVEELDAEGYDFETWIDVELQGMDGADRELAWKAMQAEGDKYLKPIMKKMFTEEELKHKDLDQMYEWLRLIRLRFRRERAAEAQAG